MEACVGVAELLRGSSWRDPAREADVVVEEIEMEDCQSL